MVGLPLAEMVLRKTGTGLDNAAALVQHLGLVVALFGAVAAERHGHLATLGSDFGASLAGPRVMQVLGKGGAALICGVLAWAAAQFVQAERQGAMVLAYGLPVWWVQASLPAGFALLGLQLAAHCFGPGPWRRVLAPLIPLAGALAAAWGEGQALPWIPALGVLMVLLVMGTPIFAVLGGLAVALFWSEGLPLASVPLSHYQITVNPSLPALPLFTLAGLLLARTDAAQRVGRCLTATFGAGPLGTVLAVALLCSAFTAFTGGSGVTILALGGLLLPLLMQSGYPERKGIGLVTSASALGVLLAPSVPMILVAILVKVPIRDMFLAGLLPALVMVASLLFFGGFWRLGRRGEAPAVPASFPQRPPLGAALWAAKWELAAPVVALSAMLGGWATPTEAAALTAAYALLTTVGIHRELDARALGRCLGDCAQIIGGVMLILGMALALTNFLVDAGIPDLAVEQVPQWLPNRYAFLVALCAFLCVAAALMEIYAAIVVLVPLLLPLAQHYGLDPLHFGILFLAAMEAGFLCPPAGMNVYFAAALFKKPLPYVAKAVGPALMAIFLGTVLLALLPPLATALPHWMAG
ncbi:TRAP transporter large permease subunit [Inhella sp. 4Y17]|uniref:TRAP transporter large permease subunit n=2 Tax=Inhella gelatinilytica TaxID=2795030 RepID=A0A931IV07_9BURK|nr:TRAP transporter large permease subunit [Inhella gelatinilytica]